jgi:hypothetical protein
MHIVDLSLSGGLEFSYNSYLTKGCTCMQGFDALRVLSEQFLLEQCSSSATTQGVYVEITTASIGSRIPLDLIETPVARPVWTYRIRIENVG